MKVKPWEVEGFMRERNADLRAVLLYGSDEGLIRERAAYLTGEIVDDPADPFRIAQLSGADLAKDPARLADEAAAVAMGGGQRLVRIDQAGDKAAPAIAAWLEAPAGDAFVIAIGSELPPRSKLRKTFEDSDLAAALPCYPDDERSLEDLIRRMIAGADATIEDDALAFLIENLGSDRMVTRRELEKLLLYARDGGGGPCRITLDRARACIGDSAAISVDNVVRATAQGDLAALDRALQQARLIEESPVRVLRALSRHFLRLHFVAGSLEQGVPFEKAVKTLRPPLFARAQKQMRADLSRWPYRRIGAALDILLEAEIGVKSSDMPDRAISERACLRLARAVQAVHVKR